MVDSLLRIALRGIYLAENIVWGREFIATDEPTVVAEPLFDAIIMEDG